MILRSIRIRNFRGIREASFDDLSDKLSLFYGPNESGKSTLVEALHFGLFEKAAGQAQHKRDLQSWGGTEAPEVEIDFEDDDGEPWHVEKRFIHQPHTLVSDRNRTWKDAQAETKLREIFHTRAGTSRGVADTDLGIWPLLWVRQGRSGLPTKDVINADARDELSDTLAARTGTAAAGPIGQAVREQVLAQYQAYWTPTGRENKAYKDILDAADAAELARKDVEDRYHEAQAKADALRRAELEVRSVDARITTQRERVLQAEAKAKAAIEAQRRLEVHERILELARRDAEQADKAVKERTSLQEQLTAARDLVGKAVDKLDLAQSTFDDLDARREALKLAHQQAHDAARAARKQLDRVQRRAERDQIEREHAELEARIQKAVDAERAARAVQDELARINVKPPDVEALEHLVQQAERARDRVDAASARVMITALADTTVDGQPLEAGATHEVRVTQSTSLQLGEVARIEVRPGEGEIDALRAVLVQADEAVARRCADLGVPSLAEARKTLDLRRNLERQRDEHRTRLDVFAPDGIHTLREALTALALKRSTAGDDDGQDLPDLAQAIALRDTTDTRLEDARAASEAHEAIWQRAREALYEARTQARTHDEQTVTLKRRLDELPGAAALLQKDEAAREALGEAVVARTALEASFAEAGGAEAARNLDAERVATERLVARHREARERVVQLRTTVLERNEAGLADELQDARALASEALAAADTARRRAEARRVLFETMEAAYRGMRDRFAAPVREAVEDNVGILFPGSRLELDDEGDVIGLRTGDVVETFDQLSGGAREQFGVLVRLGVARVLSEGRRLPVILDDALVNSDLERRGRMVEVLRRMADHLQILVFTCHDEDFDRLAAPWQAEVRGRPGRGL